jgi:hypothetical protein
MDVIKNILGEDELFMEKDEYIELKKKGYSKEEIKSIDKEREINRKLKW